MNVIEKEVHRDICTKYAGAEDYINEGIEETCYHEKLFAEGVIYFVKSLYF